jgi:hypothetical protein
MPPVTSRPIGFNRGALGDERMAAPFVGQPTIGARLEQPAPAASAMFDPPQDDDDVSWQDFADDEGTVEPAFEADVSDTEAALAALSQIAIKTEEDFPLDAFIIPEHSRSLPTGLAADAVTAEPTHTPIRDLADRLEKLSHRLRMEDSEALISRLAGGDKTDAMLAVLLAGFVAGNK